MPKYSVSVEYRLEIEARDENIAAIAAQLLDIRENELPFTTTTITGSDIIATTEEK